MGLHDCTSAVLIAELAKRGWTGEAMLVQHRPEFDREYQTECRQQRRTHDCKQGLVIAMATGHGISFRVMFLTGGSAWYEPDELIKLTDQREHEAWAAAGSPGLLSGEK